jgi:MSHA biogenesis protein MshO
MDSAVTRRRSIAAIGRRAAGVTLVELVIVIVITSILATMMAYFIGPIFQYQESRRRADMTDIADTALRRIGRDLRNALPNSVRITTAGGVTYLEFLLVRTGGRYRSDTGSVGGTACDADGTSDPSMLRFGAADKCFKTMGIMLNSGQVVAGDFVVVYNLQAGTNNNADAYQNGNVTGGNKAKIDAPLPTDETDQTRIHFEPNTFTFESPAQRFQIIEGPVTYACDPTTTKQILRYSGYNIAAAQPTPPAGTGAIAASNVTGCTFTYDSNVVAQSEGLVTISITLTSNDRQGNAESVSLVQQVHVSNVP